LKRLKQQSEKTLLDTNIDDNSINDDDDNDSDIDDDNSNNNNNNDDNISHNENINNNSDDVVDIKKKNTKLKIFKKYLIKKDKGE
jgi:hypothetical protein